MEEGAGYSQYIQIGHVYLAFAGDPTIAKGCYNATMQFKEEVLVILTIM